MTPSSLVLPFLLTAAGWLGAFAHAQTPTNAGPGPRKPGHLRMALVSIKCVLSDRADAAANKAAIQANLDRHFWFIDRAAAQGADFVGFPELSLNGYNFSANTTWLKLDGPEVAAVAKKAVEKKVYISVGLAELDAAGKKWNTQIVIGPDGRIVGRHHKIWLTAEKGHVEKGEGHEVFDVKGVKMGISICADGSDYRNLKALADKGAQVIYGPHCNSTGSTVAGWYNFRAKWGGVWDGKLAPAKTSNDGPPAEVPTGGWVNQLKVYAALHNHAGHYNLEYGPQSNKDGPPSIKDGAARWAGGAWFIGPDGKTLAQMPTSTNRADSKEYVLIHDIPLPGK